MWFIVILVYNTTRVYYIGSDHVLNGSLIIVIVGTVMTMMTIVPVVTMLALLLFW